MLLLCMATVFQFATAATATFNVTVPNDGGADGHHQTNRCMIVGNFNGWNASGAVECTKIDATHYTVTLDEANFSDKTITLAAIKYKYICGPDWAYVMKGDAPGYAELGDNTYAGTTPQVDVVLAWGSVWVDVPPAPGYYTIDIYVPKTVTECYMTGNFNGWQTPGFVGKKDSTSTKMTLVPALSDANGNDFSIKIYTSNAHALAFQFTTGPAWAYQQNQGNNKYTDVLQPTVLFDAVGDATATPPVLPQITFKRIYPGAAGLKDVTTTVKAPEGTQVMYAMGSHLNWDNKSFAAGVKQPDGRFLFTFSKIDFAEYKYYSGRGDKYSEKDATMADLGSNRMIDAQLVTNKLDTVKNWGSDWSADITPVVYMPFNGNFGTATMVGVPTYGTGKFGQAYQGVTGAYLTLPIDSTLELSVAFWYKPANDRGGILTLGTDSLENRRHGFRLFREGSATLQRVKLNVGTGLLESWNDGKEIAVGEWAHIAISISALEQRIYFNGVPFAAPLEAAMSWKKVIKSLSIGSGAPTFAYWNHLSDLGLIDELRIYNKAISDKQAVSIMNISTGLFDQKIENIEAYYANGEIRINNYVGNVSLYDFTGKVVANEFTEGTLKLNLNKGVYILRTSKGSTKLMVK